MTSCNLFVNIPFVNGGSQFAENVYEHTAPAVKRAYFEALLAEADGFASESLDVRSLTLGGGSVSTVPEEELGRLLRGLKQCFGLGADIPLYATFDPGLLTIGQANRLRETGIARPTFRYLAADSAQADPLGLPAGEVEMSKMDVLLEQAGMTDIGIEVALGYREQTPRSLETTLRKALRSTVQRYRLVLPRPEARAAREELLALYEVARRWLADREFVEERPLHFSRNGSTDPYVLDFYGTNSGEAVGTLSLGVSSVSCLDGMIWTNTGDIDAYLASRGAPDVTTESVVALDETQQRLRCQLAALWRGEAAPMTAALADVLSESGFFLPTSDGCVLANWGRLNHREAFATFAAAQAS
ncbi:hypothetical protein [uncultured Adlercreutzia sp.]|uniref:hypothetical protein n=1 Tax=uncultured Adlercreutzia sp. TaxID=875803 RepID=UPI0025FF135B|nr:hypothetical protein [uncultured Adlercreutzia sp.]